MNRRGFFKRLGQTAVGAAVVADVATEFTHKEFAGVCSWSARPEGRWGVKDFTVSAQDARRVSWSPHGPADWLELSAPILSLMASDFGVSFHCADGCLYHLAGDPNLQDTWVVRALADVYRV